VLRNLTVESYKLETVPEWLLAMLKAWDVQAGCNLAYYSHNDLLQQQPPWPALSRTFVRAMICPTTWPLSSNCKASTPAFHSSDTPTPRGTSGLGFVLSLAYKSM
jgi:hypothetical protein